MNSNNMTYLKSLTNYCYTTKINYYLNFKLISNKENSQKSKLDEFYEQN